eukprot:CAMPEP_0115390078 /NCGR_PEP_ID=MMETSP0271-20121206/10017_1 /TAXON_ID=71861 /ORGANISM="Scrippsiella trochoidea, Strain CCMP3099" /LENGTH=89 /DNA_ID=CAMNT_0002813611 /DNA_START=172 /DNA_END=439 /DNA_ORIENTATION=-
MAQLAMPRERGLQGNALLSLRNCQATQGATAIKASPMANSVFPPFDTTAANYRKLAFGMPPTQREMKLKIKQSKSVAQRAVAEAYARLV